MLRSDLCDYSDAYIVVKGTITVVRPNAAKRNKEAIFKNNAPFINCISKINGVKIDNAEDLDVVMPMYNLQQVVYGIIIEMNQVILFLLILNLLNTGKTYNIGAGEGYDANKVGKNETEVVIPLKYLSNFWRILNIPLVNCEVELTLTWSKICVLADMIVDALANPAIIVPTELEFKITDTKLYLPVVSLSKKNGIKLLKQLKSGFKRTI